MNVHASSRIHYAEAAREQLRMLAEATGWRGGARRIAEAVPLDADWDMPGTYKTVLENLGLSPQMHVRRLDKLSANELPCIFIGDHHIPLLVKEWKDGQLCVLEYGADHETLMTPNAAVGVAIGAMPAPIMAGQSDQSVSMRKLIKPHWSSLRNLIVVAAVNNILAFAAPIFVIVMYNNVIPTASVDALKTLFVAGVLVLGSELVLRWLRAQATSYIGAQIEHDLGVTLFHKLMHLPMAQLHRSTSHQQVERLKQFESIRDLFTGPLMAAALDLPFVALVIVAVYLLSPTVGLLMIAVILAYAVLGYVLLPQTKRVSAKANKAQAKQKAYLREISTNCKTIQEFGAEEEFKNGAGILSRRAAVLSARSKTRLLTIQHIGQGLTTFAGIGAIYIGAKAAIAGDLSLGGQVALTALVWRALGPVQTLFVGANRIVGFLATYRMVDRVLELEEENSVLEDHRQAKLNGDVQFKNVTLRFDAVSPPALSSVSFDVKKGEFVVICGPNGGGKSTLGNVVTRLFSPSSGTILIDGVDYRQITTVNLRENIAHALKRVDLFDVTVRENLLLSNPLASDDDIMTMFADLGMARELRRLPGGIDCNLSRMSRQSISPSLLRGIALARCLLHETPVYFLDEPFAGMTPTHAEKAYQLVKQKAGQQTVFLVSNRLDHIEQADRALYFETGRLILNEPGETAVRKIANFQMRK